MLYRDEMREEDAPWWQSRGDFQPPKEVREDLNDTDEKSTDGDDGEQESGGGSSAEDDDDGMMEEEFGRKTAMFTEYSISSSVVPRNDGMLPITG